MIDLSDGPLADLGHILELSSVGARVDSEALPLSDTFREHFPTITEEALTLALAGGEDYELLLPSLPKNCPRSFPSWRKWALPSRVIGTITAGQTVTVIGPDSREISLKGKGFTIFRPARKMNGTGRHTNNGTVPEKPCAR